jgi:DNA polymerase-3 subunit beta
MAVATDGHRLAFSSMKIEGGTFGRQEVIMPRKTILELQRLLEDIDDPSPSTSRNQASSRSAASSCVEAGRRQVPRLPARDPEGAQEHVRDRPRRAAASLQRAAILTRTSSRACAASSRRAAEDQSTNADQEEAQEELEIDYQGDTVDIGFNVTYLLDVLANLKVDTCR